MKTRNGNAKKGIAKMKKEAANFRTRRLKMQKQVAKLRKRIEAANYEDA